MDIVRLVAAVEISLDTEKQAEILTKTCFYTALQGCTSCRLGEECGVHAETRCVGGQACCLINGRREAIKLAEF